MIQATKDPVIIDGFPAFAPELALEGRGFRSEYFEKLAAAEHQNFWFRARNRLLIWALRKYKPDFHSLLEVGCGTGYVLSGINEAFPGRDLAGSELFSAGLKFAAARLPAATFMQMDARQIPFARQYDVVGAFDVIEHIEEDAAVLAQFHNALHVGGLLLVTVPQHQWLWSHSDDYACHVRRYSKDDLHSKVLAAGFRILRSTSFVSSLLPAMMASRAITRKQSMAEYDPTAELSMPRAVDNLFERFMSVDIGLIRCGLNLPIGGSRLIIAVK
jgi:trans-aconitate methyltransferase